MPSKRLDNWLKAQGHDFVHNMDAEVKLGPIYSDSWLRDPKHVLFALARYKFVAKMLRDAGAVAEVGAGDGFGAQIVAAEGNQVTCYDKAPLAYWIKQYDVISGPLPYICYNAVYSLDLFEHVPDGTEFFFNLTNSLTDHGKLIVGTPSLESQHYASEPSKKLHINCLSGDDLRKLASAFFHHVFLHSMNDEIVHTGFSPMSHYNFVVCAEPIR